MTSYRSLGTLDQFVSDLTWPIDFFVIENPPEFLKNIYVLDYRLDRMLTGITTTLWLAFEGELSVGVFGLDGIQFVIGSNLPGFTFITASFLIGSENQLKLSDLIVSLRFDSSILKPITQNQDEQTPKFVEIQTQGSICINSSFDIDLIGFDTFKLTPAMIGNTGLVISGEEVKIDLSRTETIPEIIEAGFDESFVGVFIGEAKLSLPQGLPTIVPQDLVLRRCAIGSGGVSGLLMAGPYDVDFSTGRGLSEFFGVPFGLESATIEFKQNSIVQSSIKGKLLLPFFNEIVAIEIGFDLDGNFTVELSSDKQLHMVTIPNVLKIDIVSLGFSVEDGTFTVLLGGKIKPLVGEFDWPSFDVKELAIDSDGNVRLDGGWLDLREQYSLDFYGIKIEITKLGIGKTDDGGKWIGFNGTVKMVAGMKAGASVEGLRIIWWDTDRAPSLSLNGLGVEFEVPDVLRFKGSVAFREDRERFDGAIQVSLLILDMEVNGQLVIGRDEVSGETYFAIYLGVDLPAGIPLFATGLSIYGIAGLYAFQMEPERGALPWYSISEPDWYHQPPLGVTSLRKWGYKQGGMAFGLGIVIGTAFDNGFTFSGKAMLVLSLPGPYLILEGTAKILSERITTVPDTEGMFRALAVLDGREGSFLFGLDAQYKVGSKGELIEIGGSAELFVSLSDFSAWHLYLGLKEPRDKRIKAEILFHIFRANAYFMIDTRQLAMGSWVGYDFDKKFGPVRAILEFWIEGNVLLSWKPVHYHGDYWMHGKAGLFVFGIGFSLGIDMRLAADVFDPFHLLAQLCLELGLPWPLPDVEVCLTLEWGPEPEIPYLPMPSKEFAIEHPRVSTSWPLPRNVEPLLLQPVFDADGDGFVDINPEGWNQKDFDKISSKITISDPSESVPVVPIDSYIQITFGRSVHDNSAFALT